MLENKKKTLEFVVCVFIFVLFCSMAADFRNKMKLLAGGQARQSKTAAVALKSGSSNEIIGQKLIYLKLTRDWLLLPQVVEKPLCAGMLVWLGT